MDDYPRHQDNRLVRRIPADSTTGDIEWVSVTVPDEEIDTVRLDLPGARGLVVGPDEILVVVLPQFVNVEQLDQHRHRLRESLGNRFAIVVGSDVQLAKVKTEDWSIPALPQNLGRDSGTNLGDLHG